MDCIADYSAIYGSTRERHFQKILIAIMCVLSGVWLGCVFKYRAAGVEISYDRRVSFFLSTRRASEKGAVQPRTPNSDTRLSQGKDKQDLQKLPLQTKPLATTSTAKPKAQSKPQAESDKAVPRSYELLNRAIEFDANIMAPKQNVIPQHRRYSSGLVFDPRVNEKISQARLRHSLATARENEAIETYVVASGNEVRRVGNICATNNRQMADVMGVDTMFFAKKCAIKRYDIELNIDLGRTATGLK